MNFNRREWLQAAGAGSAGALLSGLGLPALAQAPLENLPGLDAGCSQQLLHHLCIVAHQCIGSQGRAMQLVLAASGVEGQQLGAQGRLEAAAGMLQHSRCLAEVHENPVDAVQRCAGHQADIEGALSGLFNGIGHGRSDGLACGLLS